MTVRVSVHNNGSRAGREVVQVYASRPNSSVERPVRWLAGFAPVDLEAGAASTVEVVIAARAFQHWDVGGGVWATESGTFRLQVGSSSQALPLSAEITIADTASLDADQAD